VRKKKSERKKIKDRLEKLVKTIVKIRDNYTCQMCGKRVEGVNCHGSHVIPVSADGRLAFDPENLKVLCYHCHLQVWHLNVVDSGLWFEKTFPERWESLKAKHLANKQFNTIKMWEYDVMEQDLKEALSEIQNKQAEDESY